MKLNQLSPSMLLRVIRTFATENANNPEMGNHIEDMLRQAGVETIPTKFKSEIDGAWHVEVEALNRAERHVMSFYFTDFYSSMTWAEHLAHIREDGVKNADLTTAGLVMMSHATRNAIEFTKQMEADLAKVTKLILESGGAL